MPVIPKNQIAPIDLGELNMGNITKSDGKSQAAKESMSYQQKQEANKVTMDSFKKSYENAVSSGYAKSKNDFATELSSEGYTVEGFDAYKGKLAKDTYINNASKAFSQRIKGFMDDVRMGAVRRDEKVADIEANADKQTLGESMGQTIASSAGLFGDVIGAAFTNGLGLGWDLLPERVRETIKKDNAKLMEDPRAQKVLETMASGIQYTSDQWDEFKAESPRSARNVQALFDSASLAFDLYGAGVAGKGAKSGIKAGAEAVGGVVDDIASAVPKLADDVIGAMKKGADNMAEGASNIGSKMKGIVQDIEVPGFQNKNRIIDDATEAGVKNINPQTAKEAMSRGFSNEDATFLSSLSETELRTAQRMQDLAEKAVSNKRSIAGDRPIDIVGNNLINKFTPIKDLNKSYGKQLDTVAKSLRDKTLDTSPIKQYLTSDLEDLGIIKIAEGGYDFSKSVFADVDAVQNQLSKIFDRAMSLGDNAFDAHILKKSIDEVVSYGTQGEGLKGKAQGLLKMLRRQIDDTLDNTFDEYKTVNDNFRKTREVMDEFEDIIGQSTTTSKASNTIRAIFSNRQSRSGVKDLLARIDEVAKEFGVATDDNLLDQALVAEILESLYGTQAVTSLQGEVSKAIKGAKAIAEGFRDPIRGAGSLVAEGIEKVAGQTDDARKELLKKIFQSNPVIEGK